MTGKTEAEIIQVRVKMFGHLKQIEQQSPLSIEMQAGSTVSDAIHVMTRSLEEKFRGLILDRSGKLHGGIEIVLNRELLPARRIDTVRLNEDCELLLVPLIEGGSTSESI